MTSSIDTHFEERFLCEGRMDIPSGVAVVVVVGGMEDSGGGGGEEGAVSLTFTASRRK